MKNKIKQHQTKIEDDILYHIQIAHNDIARLYLDNNRDAAIQYFCEKMVKKLNLISFLYDRPDKPTFSFLKNQLNQIIKENPNTTGIMICVKNSKCKGNADVIKYIEFTI